MSLAQHPLSAAFPSMSAEDFQALKDDIEVNGQHEPVIVLDGMVLDGWHRYRACADLGMKVKQFTFAAGEDPAAFVESANLHRRHLTATQRAAAVVAVRSWAPAKRPTQQAAKPTPANKGAAAAPLSTNKEMAKAANVSVRTIKDAKAAHKAGLGEPMRDGALTAEQGANIARGKPAATPAPKAQKRELPQPAQPDADDALSEAHHTVTELANENEQLRDRLAVESLMDSEEAKTQTAETIRELRALVKTLEAENAALKVSRDTYMREAGEAKKSAIYWRKQAEKAAKPAKDAA
jgi:hypothetical protein